MWVFFFHSIWFCHGTAQRRMPAVNITLEHSRAMLLCIQMWQHFCCVVFSCRHRLLKQFCMRIRQELTSQKYIRTVVIRLLRVYRSRRRRLKYIKNKNGNQWFGWVAWWKTTKVSRDLHDLDGTTIVDRCDFCQLERHQGPHDNRL